LTLRRFGLNYDTFTREKINNSMSFGQLIDMNGFINTKEAESKLYEQEVELQNKYNKKEIDKQLINE